MKKTLLVIALVCAAAGAVLGQEGAGGVAAATMSDVNLLNLTRYAEYFGFRNGAVNSDDQNYIWQAPRADRKLVRDLGGDEIEVDTPLEFAILSYYSEPVVNIRPVEAKNVLPVNKTSELKLGSAVLKELAEIKFLDPNNRDVVGRYEGIIKFITDRGNVTRAEIESYYRQGIGSLIAEAVDAEFNKIGFMIDRNYNAVLTRNPQNRQYELSYEGVGNVTKKLTATSLETLSSAMSRSGDFSATAFSEVRANAALIPAVAIAQSGQTEAVQGTVKKALTDFYVNPVTANYNTVKDIYALFMRRAWEYHQDPLFEIIRSSYASALGKLSVPLFSKVSDEANQEKYAASTLTQTQISDLTVRR